MGAFVISVLLSILISFVCSVSEAALLSVSHAQAQALAESGAGRILKRFKAEIDISISAILILNTTANVIGAALAGVTSVAVFGPDALVWFPIAFTLVLLLLGEIIPKTVGVVHTARIIVPVVYVVQGMTLLLRPVIWLTRLVTQLIRGAKAPVTSLEEIRLLVELGRSEGALAVRTAKMIDGAARIKEMCAYDVMVPRTATLILDGQDTLAEVLKALSDSGYSRLPFSSSGEADKIDGIIMTRELLFALNEAGISPPSPRLQERSDEFLKPLARKADYVPESMSVEDLLRRFQETRHHMAIVVDEYGGTEGIVTLEDVLEEIVGEIQDESDAVTAFITRRANGDLLCRGRAETRKVFELISESDQAESVTLAGYIAEKLGRVPVKGDRVQLGDHQFTVQRASGRHAERILVTNLSQKAEPGK